MPHRRPRAGRKALGHGFGGSGGVDPGPEQGRQAAGFHLKQGLLFAQKSFVDQVHRDPHRRLRGALAVAGLKEVEPAPLHRELEILHVTEMTLQPLGHLDELGVKRRLLLLEPGQRLGGADPGHHVLPLGIAEVLAVELLGPGGGIAGKTHPGPGIVAQVAEDHRLHVDRGTEVVGDAVVAAVDPGAGIVPALEDRPHRPLQLPPGVLGEFPAGFPNQGLVASGHLGQRLGG